MCHQTPAHFLITLTLLEGVAGAVTILVEDQRAVGEAVLHKILCLKETRVVKNDHTVSFQGLVLQIPPCKTYPCMADRKVHVRDYRDGHIEIIYRDSVVARFSSEAISRLLNSKSVQHHMKMAA